MRTLTFLLTLLAPTFVASCDPYVEPVGRSYAPCETDADCDRAAPECRLFQLANGVSARWCTKECEYSEDCHDNVDVSLGSSVCSGFTDEGIPDDDGSLGRCSFICAPSSTYCPYEGQSCTLLTETSLRTICATPITP